MGRHYILNVAFGATYSKVVSLSTPFTTGCNTGSVFLMHKGILLGEPHDNVQQHLSKLLAYQAQFAAQLWVFSRAFILTIN